MQNTSPVIEADTATEAWATSPDGTRTRRVHQRIADTNGLAVLVGSDQHENGNHTAIGIYVLADADGSALTAPQARELAAALAVAADRADRLATPHT